MSELKTAQALTKDDFRQAVAQAGGPEAVLASLERLRLATAQFDKDYSRILEHYPRHWIAMGTDGMIANIPVSEDPSVEDQEQTLKRLLELIEESGRKRSGCLIKYIDPEEGILIL